MGHPKLEALSELGQSVWVDHLSHPFAAEGELARLVEMGVRGVTSNPSIFKEAITKGRGYEEALASLLAQDPRQPAEALYEALAVEDVRLAADCLASVYEASRGSDGFVSLEVSPRLAHDARATIDEAVRLWRMVARPNVMIKVPATEAGFHAIEELLTLGVPVNITLIFSLRQYEAVAQAYLAALRRRQAEGQPLETVRSVASFFVSRVDTAVDRALEAIGSKEALSLRGQAAVANARLAARRFQELFGGDSFEPLKTSGANVQRLLWASTSTKNPAYSDLLYVEPLMGRDTVNTMPLPTLQALLDHGSVAPRLDAGKDEAEALFGRLRALDVDIDAICRQLLTDGVQLFADAYAALLAALEARAGSMVRR